MADEVPDNIKKVAKELYHEVDDNIQFNDDKNQIRFAKLRMSAEVVDFLMEHYGFFDFVELNQICLLLLKRLQSCHICTRWVIIFVVFFISAICFELFSVSGYNGKDVIIIPYSNSVRNGFFIDKS